MSSQNSSELFKVIKKGKNPFGVGSSLMLCWLMNADGNISKEEEKILESFMSNYGLSNDRLLLQRIVENFDIGSFELASQILRDQVTEDGKYLLLDLFLGMILADGYITYTEIYVIEFIADLFSISPNQLNQVFIKATGKPKTKTGDPSSSKWWEEKEKKTKQKKRQNYNSNKSPNTNTKRLKAFAVLGLDESADLDEIKAAFRFLAKVHHPDRFDKLGEGAKKTAHSTFIRINEAYQFLIEND